MTTSETVDSASSTATVTDQTQPRYPGSEARKETVTATSSSRYAPTSSPTAVGPASSSAAARATATTPSSAATGIRSGAHPRLNSPMRRDGTGLWPGLCPGACAGPIRPGRGEVVLTCCDHLVMMPYRGPSWCRADDRGRATRTRAKVSADPAGYGRMYA